MTNEINLKELIPFLAMNFTATDLEIIRMERIVKDTGAIVETYESNVRRLVYPFAYSRSKKLGWNHAKMLMNKET